jgi:hypothetical protein
MNFENESYSERENNITRINEIFDCFDLEPKIPIVVVDYIEEHEDAKMAFCFDEKDGEIVNERYEISSANIDQEFMDQERINNFVVHEVRHRIQREKEFKDQDLALFSEDIVLGIGNDAIRNYLIKYISNLPDDIRENKRELDSKICESLISISVKEGLISDNEINSLIDKNSSYIVSYLLNKIS